MSLAITENAVLIAASLRQPLGEGIWFALATEPAAIAKPYEHMVNGYTIEVTDQACEMLTGCCPMGDVEFTGKRRPPAEAARCRAQLAQHASLEARLAVRYTRRFRLDKSGIRELGTAGQLQIVRGANSIWKDTPSGSTVEVSLPLVALPRMSQPALGEMQGWAGSTTRKIGEIAKEKQRLIFPKPLIFQPHAELRQALIELQGRPNRGEFYKRFYYGTFGLSYQPGESNYVEMVEYRSKMTLATRQIPLYRTTKTYGDYVVGEAIVPIRHIEISKQGKVLLVLRWDYAKEEIFTLDGLLMAAWYEAPRYEWMTSTASGPKLQIVSISEEPGAPLAEALDEPEAWLECEDKYTISPGIMTVSPGFDSWVWNGTCRNKAAQSSNNAAFVVSWKWDKKEKLFLGQWQ